MRPIHYACDRGNLDILNALLETNQVDVNCQDSEGQTPLMYAITCEQLVMSMCRIYNFRNNKYITQL